MIDTREVTLNLQLFQCARKFRYAVRGAQPISIVIQSIHEQVRIQNQPPRLPGIREFQVMVFAGGHSKFKPGRIDVEGIEVQGRISVICVFRKTSPRPINVGL